MNAFAKGIPWLAFLLCLSHLACFLCAEEEALLLEDKDFCTVPGAADVKACDWIVEQLEDQNPDLTYDFFCSKEEDCDSDFVEGEVADWFSGGCNGPKIINHLCGCCVFVPNVAPGNPTNLAANEVTATSATITWTDGSPGFPEETYTVRCFEGETEDCKSTDFAGEVTGIPRGVEEGTVAGLEPGTEYSCFVLAVNEVAPDGICSDGLLVETDPLPVFKLTLALLVDTCDAFDEVAVVEAFCEAFIEEAGFPAETVCLTEESECGPSSVNGRRRLNDNGLQATIVLAGDFGGQTEEEVVDATNAVLQDGERLQNVQENAVELLVARGTQDFADALSETGITGGTSAVEDAEPECTTNDDCEPSSTNPICVSSFCVACGPIERPAIQGSCQGGDFCRETGRCLGSQCDVDSDCGANLVCSDNECKCELEGLEPREVDGVCIAPPGIILVFDSQGNPVPATTSRRRLLNEGDAFNFPTIQSAIEAAEEDSTIYVGSGTYEEFVSINKDNLSLRGPNFGLVGYDSNLEERNMLRVPEATVTREGQEWALVFIQAPRENVVWDGFAISEEAVTDISIAMIVGSEPSGFGDGSLNNIQVRNTVIEAKTMTIGIAVLGNQAVNNEVTIQGNFIQIDEPDSFACPTRGQPYPRGYPIFFFGSNGLVAENVGGGSYGIQVSLGPLDVLVEENTFRTYTYGLVLTNLRDNDPGLVSIRNNAFIAKPGPTGNLFPVWQGIRLESVPQTDSFQPVYEDPFLVLSGNNVDASDASPPPVPEAECPDSDFLDIFGDPVASVVGVFFRNYKVPIGTSGQIPASLQFTDNSFTSEVFDIFVEAVAAFAGNSDTFDISQVEEVFTDPATNNQFPTPVIIEDDATGTCCLVVEDTM